MFQIVLASQVGSPFSCTLSQMVAVRIRPLAWMGDPQFSAKKNKSQKTSGKCESGLRVVDVFSAWCDACVRVQEVDGYCRGEPKNGARIN